MMNFKVVIADDDEILLEGLMTKIDWKALGIEIVAGASNGVEALRLVKEMQPNLLLTDVKMPHMDGIELIQEIKKTHANIAVIVISAYDEFKFAQAALKMGAIDYVLKPINIENLIGIVKRAVADEKKKNSLNEKIQYMERLEEEQESLIVSKMYEDGMVAKYSKSNYKILYEKYLENNTWNRFLVAVLKNNLEGSYYNEIQRYLIENYPQTIKAYYVQNKLVFLFLSNDVAGTNIFDVMKKEIKDHFQEKFVGINLAFANGSIVNDIYDLNDSIKEAVLVDELTYLKNDEWNLSLMHFKENENNSKKIANSLAEKIYQATFKGDYDLLIKYLERYSDNLKYCKSEAKNLFVYNTNYIFAKISDDCDVLNIKLNKTLYDGKEPLKIILQQGSLKEKLYSFSENMKIICNYFKVSVNGGNQQLIKNSCDYINSNFSNSALRINDVANYVGLSKNYFSTLFSTIKGKTFTDYLTEIRIKESQKLILTSKYRNYEIAYKVGFENPTYFSFAFKKFVGVNPTDYLKMINE